MTKQIFYTDPISNNVWRVSLYLREKKITPDEVKVVSIFKGEQKQPDFLAINPRGQLPAWQDGDLIITESLAIMMYLESKHKENPLIPTDPKDYSLFLTRIFQFQAELDRTNLTVPALLAGKTKGDLKERIEGKMKELRYWDDALQGREYFANKYSLLDIAILPLITTDARVFGLDLTLFPNLNAWFQRMWEKPAVKETCTFVDAFNGLPHDRVLEGATRCSN